jgi:hypothetical protein
MDSKSTLTLVAQPQDFFRELITEALADQKVATQPETEFYLVNLLNQFMTTERLSQEPLAFMVKDALEQPSLESQRLMLRQVGDVSLYVAGFFQDSLNRKLVDVDYYIDMGGTAYKHVAARADEDIFRALYEELAQKFASFVEVFAHVSDKTARKTERDLLRVYELWVRTRSERAAKQLQEAGILPNDTIKSDWQ